MSTLQVDSPIVRDLRERLAGSPLIAEILMEMDLDQAISSLDEMFYGWLASERCSDELSSQKERGEIGFYYRKIKEMLTRCSD